MITSFLLLILLTQIGQKNNFQEFHHRWAILKTRRADVRVNRETWGSSVHAWIKICWNDFPPNLWPGRPPAFSIKPAPPTVWGEPNQIKTRRYHGERHSDGSAPHFFWQSDDSVRSFLDLRSHRMPRAASKRQLIANKDPSVANVAAKLSAQHGVLAVLVPWQKKERVKYLTGAKL